jgi:hypothetical protein
MATQTYDPIASITLGAATASVTFSAIPQTYTDLVIVMFSDQTASSASNVQFNGDTATNYSLTNLSGDGSTATSTRASSASTPSISASSANDQITIMNIMNYSNTTTYKTSIIRTNDASSSVGVRVILWRSTAAITSIRLASTSSTFTSNSTFNLYGIKAA